MTVDAAAISEIDDADAVRIAIFRDGKLLHAPLSTVLQFATDELTAYGASIANALYKTGDVKKTVKKTAETGWLLLDGKTIGSASSGGTARANADTSALFTLLWTDWDNTVLPIQDSSGSPTTRGASAAADFAANKRLPLPDHRERVAAGWDNLADVTRLSAPVAGDTIGSVGGSQSHTLTTTETPSHTHSFSATTSSDGAHTHELQIGQITGTAGTRSGWDFTSYSKYAAGTDNIVSAAAHTHTVSGTTGSSGSGSAHNNVQPTIVFNYQVKL